MFLQPVVVGRTIGRNIRRMATALFTDANAQETANLLREEADHRFKCVGNVSYSLNLNIAHAGDMTSYGCVTQVNFNFDKSFPNKTNTLHLDFTGSKIVGLAINGKETTAASGVVYNAHRIIFPSSLLAAGSNSIIVAYESEYDTTGQGFHRFVDPEDNQVYLYTNFEPFDAHRLFPCFNQPDLKATYTTTVTAPDDWKVISCSPMDATSKKNSFFFPPTPKPFSTYIYAIIAGPYVSFHDTTADGIPLGLHCRKSLAKFLDTKEIFATTRHGMAWYADFFRYRYPWGKYDQVFVPEFNQGAMENTGCVVHSERMVYRDPPTTTQRIGRADTILHELAHMWFGNLVTMKWWDGLWLNESFATYMAAACTAELPLFPEGLSWQSFNSGMKAWAYREDQLCTTHAIQCQVPDTESTFLNFDGITYGKGASVLKQLVFALGNDAFRKGMDIYFHRHEYSNTELTQFLQALQDGQAKHNHETNTAASVDLTAFSREWLERAGLNSLSPEYRVDTNSSSGNGSTITSFEITQTPSSAEHPTLRTHHLEVALYQQNGQLTRVVRAKVAGDKTRIDALIGAQQPALAFINHNDHAYAKIMLDDASLAFVKANMDIFKDSLTRQLLYRCQWDMVRDAKLSSIDYITLAERFLPVEPDTDLLSSIIANIRGAVRRFVPQTEISKQALRMFTMAQEQVRKHKGVGDIGITWLRFLCAMGAENKSTAQELVRIMQRDADITLDQDMRWDIAITAVAWGLPEADALVAAETERDGKTDRGQRNLMEADAAKPDKENKKRLFESYLKKMDNRSLHMTAASMSGFYWSCQESITAEFRDQFFDVVVAVFKHNGNEREYSQNFFSYMYPDQPATPAETDAVAAKTRKLLESIDGEKDVMFHRTVRESLDDLERAIRCRAYAAARLK